MSMVTDTQRILRTQPGRPEVCNVCQLHRFFSRRLRDDLGRRAHGPHRLRGHQAPAGGPDPRLLRRGARAASRAGGEARLRGGGAPRGRRTPCANRRRDAARVPRPDGPRPEVVGRADAGRPSRQRPSRGTGITRPTPAAGDGTRTLRYGKSAGQVYRPCATGSSAKPQGRVVTATHSAKGRSQRTRRLVL